MSKEHQKSLLADIDVEGIIKKSIRSSAPEKPKLDESYVAEPKVYRQVSEFVSQKTKDAHIAHYQEHVQALNRVSAELDGVERTDANSIHSTFRSLKLDETFNLDAVWLHELFFAAFFDPHSEIYMDSSAYIELERNWGTFDDWQKDFLACAMACGQGWAVCGYNMFLKRFVNTMVSNHSQDIMIGLYPLIVLDMHEHAYFRDYLGDRKSYAVAMMRQIDWNVIEERFNRAKAFIQVLK